MRYYLASYSGLLADEVTYKEQGGSNDLYLHFPELKAIIDRYPFKSIDFRLTNGDRLRVYDIKKASAGEVKKIEVIHRTNEVFMNTKNEKVWRKK